jgi:hypothetical protein
MKIHLWVSLARGFGSRRPRDRWKCSWDSEWAESRRREPQARQGFRAGCQTRHQRPGKEERSPSCSILRLSILCHFEGEEVFSFADSDVLTLVCASRTRERALPAMALGRTAYKRNTSAEQALESPDRPPVCMDLIQFFAKSLLLVEVLMCTYPAETCAGKN